MRRDTGWLDGKIDIRDRKYTQALERHSGEIVLVGWTMI